MDDLNSGTRPVSDTHAFDVAALEAWLGRNLPDFAGPLTVEQFKGGQSNPTYKLITPGRAYVMRSKPGPLAKLLPSAHAIEREYKVMGALALSGVPVARMHVLCEDESVIGRAFYVMECVQGRVLWDQGLPGMSPDERGAIYDEMNRVIATLHSVDPKAVGLADFGKPGNYFARQIGRWSKQYQASVTEDIPAMNQLIDWLPAHMPASALDETQVSIVHGDYRLDNLIFHPDEPRIVAVLDWELSTLGHPLADFSYHCMSWHISPGTFRGIAGLDLAALGIPAEREYIQRYCARTGRGNAVDALLADWNFYLAYNLFRLAAITQGIAKRVVDGIAASAQAKATGAATRSLAELGWQFAQKA
ncbi:MAG: phosphotransferase family protein [Burkholderiaceae bacterium]|nr:phosphotransferase family protein [Burkholderiaceae bacterium]